MKFLKSWAAKIGLTLGLAIGVAAASLAVTYYYGWNPSTGLETTHGVEVDGSAGVSTVTIVQAGQTISGQVGGANAGSWVATGATTAAGTLTFSVAVPTQRVCSFVDNTTRADLVGQTTAVSKTVVTISGTIVSGDQISYQCEAY